MPLEFSEQGRMTNGEIRMIGASVFGIDPDIAGATIIITLYDTPEGERNVCMATNMENPSYVKNLLAELAER